MRGQGYDLEPVEGIQEAFLLRGVEAPGATLEYFLGYYQVQGLTSMLPTKILGPRPGEIILDLCAAPGSKTTHLAQLMQDRGCIVAVDVGRQKLSLLRENQNRLGIRIALPVLADASRSLPWKSDLRFDKVLVDAPCSGLGILRRHPEGKWTKSPELIDQLKAIQLCPAPQVSAVVERSRGNRKVRAEIVGEGRASHACPRTNFNQFIELFARQGRSHNRI